DAVTRGGLHHPIVAEPGYRDRLVARIGFLAPIYCPVCGRISAASGFSWNLRETGACRRCGAHNRNRQLALIACRAASELSGRRIRSLRALSRTGINLYNTESQGAIHDQLRDMSGYRCSEYLGPQHVPGERVGDVTHEDLSRLSFSDESIDIVLSSDV